jgi:hypothetical protein
MEAADGQGKRSMRNWSTVVAAVSLVVSIGAFGLSWKTHGEATSVDFAAAGSINSYGSTPAGYAVRISLVNQSLRPIIVRSIELEESGRPIAPITTFLTDSRASTDASALGDEPLEDARPFPLTLPSRGAQTLTGFADFSDAAAQAQRHEVTPLLKRARRFCRELKRVGPASGETSSSMELEIQFEPGGTTKVPVLISNPKGGVNNWHLEVTGPADHPSEIVFWRRIAAPTALRLVTLKIWTWDGHLKRTARLPVSGAAYAQMGFAPLPRDSYRAALFQNGEPLAVGLFHVPLDEPHETIYPSAAQRVNGECMRIRGKRNVYNYARTPFAHPAGSP